MNKSFNQLTPQQAELFALLAEECGEVVQIVGKILRHGLDSYHPHSGETNRETLQKELGDVWAAVELLRFHGGCSELTGNTLFARMHEKLAKVGAYLHHTDIPPSEEGGRS